MVRTMRNYSHGLEGPLHLKHVPVHVWIFMTPTKKNSRTDLEQEAIPLFLLCREVTPFQGAMSPLRCCLRECGLWVSVPRTPFWTILSVNMRKDARGAMLEG